MRAATIQHRPRFPCDALVFCADRIDVSNEDDVDMLSLIVCLALRVGGRDGDALTALLGLGFSQLLCLLGVQHQRRDTLGQSSVGGGRGRRR